MKCILLLQPISSKRGRGAWAALVERATICICWRCGFDSRPVADLSSPCLYPLSRLSTLSKKLLRPKIEKKRWERRNTTVFMDLLTKDVGPNFSSLKHFAQNDQNLLQNLRSLLLFNNFLCLALSKMWFTVWMRHIKDKFVCSHTDSRVHTSVHTLKKQEGKSNLLKFIFVSRHKQTTDSAWWAEEGCSRAWSTLILKWETPIRRSSWGWTGERLAGIWKVLIQGKVGALLISSVGVLWKEYMSGFKKKA